MRTKGLSIVLAVALAVATAPSAGAQGAPYSAGEAIGRAEAAAREVEALRADADVDAALRANPQLTRKLHQADARLALARDALSEGRSPYRVGEAREFAIAAERAYREVARVLMGVARRQQRQADDEAARAALRAELRAIARDVRELLERPHPSSAAVLQRRAELVRAARAARELDDSAPLERLREVRDRLVVAEQALRDELALGPPPAVMGGGGAASAAVAKAPAPPAALKEAVQAFFAGDYAATAALLDQAPLTDPQSAKVAHLLRGAALFSLWVDSGERDPSLLERARAEVRACRAVDPTFDPDRVAFSPRFVELFASIK
ncbi:MAG: hypothetical protein HRF46_03790 [Acidobacteriota bacterium]|jgi:hypothetical protein